MKTSGVFAAFLSSLHLTSAAIQLNINDQNSIRNAARTIASEMVTTWYRPQDPPYIKGLLVQPYYWWSCGAMFGTLIDYWYYTGDDRFNQIVTEGMMFQTGPNNDFMPPNQTASLGNDDQAFWGIAAMSAAEQKFPDPPEDKPSWLSLAQATFNTQVVRWNEQACGGGLKWQIFTWNQGYDYRNAITNGCFFNLAARLGMYTGNDTYLYWAERTWDWSRNIGILTSEYFVYDGTHDPRNCTDMNKMQWTYNAGVYLLGAATMWNVTEGAERAKWEERVRGMVKGADVFFKDNIMIEASCEGSGTCNKDQESFKAYLARWMAASIKVAPFVEPLIAPKLEASAQAAAKACSGGDSGNRCGLRWTQGSYDGFSGVGYQMSALEIIQGLLIDTVRGPVGHASGGTSKGNPLAGTDESLGPNGDIPKEITTADRAGAGIVTAIVLIGTVSGAWWMLA